ncbi:MAG: hypothetical protein WBP26_00100 [Candidatus Saccharimonadales bacterium]
MGLDFTNIKDGEGAALYILHAGNTLENERLQRLADEVQKNAPHQVVMLDVSTADGEKVRDFYDIMPEQLPAMLVVRDDDSLAYQWHGNEIPTSGSDIAYRLRQTSE